MRSNYRGHTGSLFWDEPPFVQERPPFISARAAHAAPPGRVVRAGGDRSRESHSDLRQREEDGGLRRRAAPIRSRPPRAAGLGGDITFVQFRKIEIKELPPSPESQKQPLPPTFKNSIGMEFVLVPKGKSWLGGGKDKLGDKEVEIPADFYLGKYEVTQEEWEKVMGENPSHFSRDGRRQGRGEGHLRTRT